MMQKMDSEENIVYKASEQMVSPKKKEKSAGK